MHDMFWNWIDLIADWWTAPSKTCWESFANKTVAMFITGWGIGVCMSIGLVLAAVVCYPGIMIPFAIVPVTTLYGIAWFISHLKSKHDRERK